MLDVGGQRNERKKWMHSFESVTAVIFVAAMSEYDQVLYEDGETNRVHEAIELFGEIVNSKWFYSTSMILFLNKSDLFEEKIKRVDMSCCFDDYTGGLDFTEGSDFLLERFLEQNEHPNTKKVYHHITCATDTANIKFTFNVIKDIILRNRMKEVGLFQ
jgi:hypothetical protein